MPPPVAFLPPVVDGLDAAETCATTRTSRGENPAQAPHGAVITKAPRMRQLWKALLLIAGPLLALTGCDGARLAQLRMGQSTEADVCAQFGQPNEVYLLTDGARQLEFSRQPEGVTNFMITLGADGKLRSIVQTLQADTFAQIKPGLSQGDVRKLLGRPAYKRHFALKNEDLWEWRWQDGPQTRLFGVTFNAQGAVASTATGEDLRNQH